MENSLVEQGIEQFRAGDRAAAYQTLRRATEENPDDARAWYYLAGAAESVEERRTYLERVLEIMPDNEKAREQLAKLPPTSQEESFSFDEAPSEANRETGEPAAAPQSSSGPLDEPASTAPPLESIPAPAEGFSLPISIPDAPEKLNFDYIVKLFVSQFQSGLAILQKTPGAYPREMRRATWWHFWFYLVTANLLIAAMATIGLIFNAVGLFLMLIFFVLTIPVGIATTYAGLYASHWYAATQAEGRGSLVQHAYSITIPLVTASLIANAISLVLNLLPFLGLFGGIISLVLTIYALFVAADGLEMVHKVSRNTTWVILIIMFVVQFLVGAILGSITASIVVGATISSLL